MFVALLAAPPAPADDTAAPSDKHLMPAMLWSLLPGGGFFYLGDTSTGATYAALTATLLGAGAAVDHRNQRLHRDDEVNVPSVMAEKVWEYSVFSTWRSALAVEGVDLRAQRFDDTPTPTLLSAPFNPRYAARWEVAGAMLLGVAGAAIDARDKKGTLQQVDRAHMLGNDYNNKDATALYTVSALGVSLGAATAEEGLFRGVLQPILQERWGDTAGLWATAGAFGAAHIVAPDGSFNPGGVAFGTAAGAYLGWLYNRDGDRLGGPIAAHFWYDFAIFAASWAMDPDNTPFGFHVDFKF